MEVIRRLTSRTSGKPHFNTLNDDFLFTFFCVMVSEEDIVDIVLTELQGVVLIKLNRTELKYK